MEEIIHSKEFIEIFGYFASSLVVISLMMNGIVKLRIINLIGALLFASYGFVIHAYPVLIVNGMICFVDIYYLYDIFKTKEFFNVLEVSRDSDYLNYFIRFHKMEIKEYMPAFIFSVTDETTVFFILRNSIPAGLIIAEKLNDDKFFIELDFVIPGYRDLKIGKYVYNTIFAQTNVKQLYSHPGNVKHENYLRKMGFMKLELNGEPVYCLENL